MMKFRTTQDIPNFYYDLEGVRRDPQGNLFTPDPGQLPTTLTRPRPEMVIPFMGNMNFMGGPNDKLTPIDPYRNTQLAGLSQDGQRFDSAQSAFDALAEYTRKAREFNPGTRDVIGTELYQGDKGFENFTNYFNQVNDPNYTAPSPQLLASSQQNMQRALPGLFAKGGRAGYYTGGMVDVEPNLSDIGHGSDALMARTRLISPGAQGTTSTGLNYLLAEDNDNIRVPFSKGKVAKEILDKGRRGFMKAAGAGAAGLAALKTGLINLAEQAGPKIEKVTENFSSTASEAPGYFFDLVTKIKSFGKQSKVGPSERVNEYSYVGKNGDQYTLTEDITTGDAQIIKDKMGVGSYGDKTFDTINDRTVMEYKAPKQDVDVEAGKGTKEATEYEEYKVEFDSDGTEAGADAIDEITQKEIIEEASEKIIKKADGGRIGYSKGKIALKAGEKIKTIGSRTLAFLEKVFGKEAMAEMPKRDPEMYQGLLEVTEAFRARDKEGLKMYLQKFLPHMDDTEIEDFIIGSDGTEGLQGQLIRLGSGRDYAGKLEMMKRSQEMKKLRDLDVTEDMKRKPNASGGIAKLLGE